MDEHPPGRGVIGVSWAALAAVVLVLAAGGLAGCGGDDGGDGGRAATSTTASGTPTSDDLDQLSLFLLRDYQAGGAQVEVRFASAGRTVTMTGVVDWADHAGDLEVVDAGEDGAAGGGTDRYEVRFTADHVYESLPAEEVDRLAAAGRPGVTWSVRAPAPADDPLDRVLALLVSFAAEQPDNPALLASKGFTVEDRQPVGERAATTFRSSTDALYAVDDEQGVLLRFQGVVAGIDEPVTVDLSGFGARSVEVPEEATTLAAGEPAGG